MLIFGLLVMLRRMIPGSFFLFVLLGGCGAPDKDDDGKEGLIIRSVFESVYEFPEDSDIQEAIEEFVRLVDAYQNADIEDARLVLLREIELMRPFLGDERFEDFPYSIERLLAYSYTRLYLIYTHLGKNQKAKRFLKMGIEVYPVEARLPVYRELAYDEFVEKLIEVAVWIDKENDVRWIQDLDEEAIEALK